MPYNAMTIDVFPVWAHMLKAGNTFLEEWSN